MSEPYKLQEGWQWVRLGEVCEIIKGKKPELHEMQDSEDGSAIPHLEKEIFYNLAISLPPLSIQHHIASYFKEKMAYVEKLRISIEKQLEAINALQQAILKKAFRGEL